MGGTMPEGALVEELYRRHERGVRRLLARMVGEHDAEDLTHDVFERAQRALGTYRAESRPATWLYRIATHVAIDLLRNRAVREREDPSVAAPSSDARDFAPDREAVRRRTRACILELIARLPVNQRAVLVFSEIRGLSDREAAEALGITLSSAKIQLHRARKALRALMTCECSVYRDEWTELVCERAAPAPVLPAAS